MSDTRVPGIAFDGHPALEFRAFVAEFPAPLGELETPATVRAALDPRSEAPLQPDDDHRKAIRDMLRHGGYKPTGRGKPASEYLIKAADSGGISSINVAVDICNAVSLHSGVPISVVDLDRASAPFRIATAEAGTSYVFNQAGQTIDLSGLLCLFDASGPCANSVRDSQRTKTSPQTTHTLSVLWGTRGFESRLDQADAWYRALLGQAGARTTILPPS